MRLDLSFKLSSWLTRASSLIALCLVLAALSVFRVVVPDPFERLQNYTFDSLQRIFPRLDADRLVPGSGVVVVDIDEPSLARHGQWPWSRLLMSRLIGALQDAGARAIGLDVVFAEPDRTSPALLAPLWAREHGLRVSDTGAQGSLPDYDLDLARVIGRGRIVTGFGLVAQPTGRTPVTGSGIAYLGRDAPSGLSDFGGAIPNLPALDEAAAGQGSFTIASTGPDEVIRRLPLVMSLDGTLLPALSVELLRVAADPEGSVRLRQEATGAGALLGYTAAVGDLTIPLASDGTVWLHYGARSADRTWSAARVIDESGGDTLRRAVGGRIVLIGTSAVGLSDLRPTPLSAFEPGVNIHAGAIEQILGGGLLRRPAGAAAYEFCAAAALALAAGLAVAGLGARIGAALAATIIAGALAASAVAFVQANLLIDPSLVTIETATAFVVTMLVRHLVAERRANALRGAFAHYLSPQLVETLARDPDRLSLGGEEREMSFLFTDLEGFTSFTETAEPAVLVATLNAYLDGACRIAMEHGATVDKIVGDAIHLMFNAPVDQPDHAARAVRCALAIDRFATAFAAAHASANPDRPPFGVTRIGVNTGRAVVGNFGGDRRFDYTAHGDAINTAARLEAANKRLGTRICVSDATVAALGDAPGFPMRPIGALALKGKARRVMVFAPLGEGAAELSWSDRYVDAFARLSRGEPDGAAAILALFADHPDDPLLAFHARRIAAGHFGTGVASEAA